MKLREWLRGSDAATESGSERDGFLSYAKEWHALVIGLGAGLASGLTGRYEIVTIVVCLALGLGGAARLSKNVRANVSAEPWYAIGGAVAGLLIGVALASMAGVTVPWL